MKVIAEIGINFAFGGDRSKFVDNAKKLITIASVAGCDYVKFQKRTPEVCVPEHQKNKEKKVPWREDPITYLQYKKDSELSKSQYEELISFANSHGVQMFASVWDVESALLMSDLTNIVKIPSALLTDLNLLEYCRERFDERILSTGMSTEEEIERAVEIYQPSIIMHTNSKYPTPVEDLNMGYIDWLQERYSHHGYPEIGLSSHYWGITDAIYAMGKGITWLEKHVCLNHDLWGSDQSASVEPHGLFEMMKKIRDMEKAGSGFGPRIPFPGEEEKRKSLRK